MQTAGVNGYINEYTGAQHIVPALAPHLFPDEHNRRSSPRVGLGVPVSYRVRQHHRARAEPQHQQGWVGVAHDQPARDRRGGEAAVPAAEGAGTISRPTPVSPGPIERVGMGLQFTRIDPSDQAALDAYVQCALLLEPQGLIPDSRFLIPSPRPAAVAARWQRR